jgi:phosphoesterase RecJ-like protein
VGSSVALARLLRAAGKRSAVWHRDPSPSIFRTLEGVSEIHTGPTPPAGFPEAFDLLVVLECPTLDRTGLADSLTALPCLNIDHHLGNTAYGVASWIDTEAPAVAVLVQSLATHLRIDLDASTAQGLYLALSTDTGNFRFTNATAAAFESAAELVRRGARPDIVAHWIYGSQPAAAVRLLGEMLASLELHASGRIAYVELRPEMFARAGAGPADTEGLIDSPRSIAGVEAVALLRLNSDGSWKGSLRSRDPIDVEIIARRFGGGGHRNAAGFGVAAAEGTGIKARVLAALEEATS